MDVGDRVVRLDFPTRDSDIFTVLCFDGDMVVCKILDTITGDTHYHAYKNTDLMLKDHFDVIKEKYNERH